MIIPVKDGEYTTTVYTFIKEQKFPEAVAVLNQQAEMYENNRAALSLLGYCYYQMQDFVNGADCYEQLSQLHSEIPEYRLYYAQCLFGAGLFNEADKVASSLGEDHPEFMPQVTKLVAAIKFSEDDLQAARVMVEQASKVGDDQQAADNDVNLGCIAYKEDKFADAQKLFTRALKIIGYDPQIAYNIALCHYRVKQYASALKLISEIIERGINEHPELNVGMKTDGIDVKSVGNSLVLHESALVEAFNLKAAIEYQLQNFSAAKQALTDMPPRNEEELDGVSLHNVALMNMDDHPTPGFEKLQFLMQQNPCPPETFGNLLLLYVKHDYCDLAADIMAENAHLTFGGRGLPPFLFEFLDAVITRAAAPEEAARKLDAMTTKLSDKLSQLTKQVKEARHNHDDEAVKRYVGEYDDTIEKYVPSLMQHARIFWDIQNFDQVEKIFRKSVEFCNDREVWKLNVGHVLFMQEKYKEATTFYEPIVKNHYDNLLSLSAVILANLCVAYIMTGQNEEAEELMRRLEKAEEVAAYREADRKFYHQCIVNVVIGTLYCSKGNYEFGIGRVMKALEPFAQKLSPDTWYYVKRCFLSLLENMAKQMLLIRDAIIDDCIQFLDSCEFYGVGIKACVEAPLEAEPMHPGRNTVAWEARLLKALLLKIVFD